VFQYSNIIVYYLIGSKRWKRRKRRSCKF